MCLRHWRDNETERGEKLKKVDRQTETNPDTDRKSKGERYIHRLCTWYLLLYLHVTNSSNVFQYVSLFDKQQRITLTECRYVLRW